VVFAKKPLFNPAADPFQPLEFSVAAFRFGHSQVRGGYDLNRNFGAAVPGQAVGPLQGFATLVDLFAFTGGGKFNDDPKDDVPALKSLPSNWIIEWDRLSRKEDPNPAHFARKIDTQLAPPLGDLLNEGNDKRPGVKELLKHLARRNLLRGYALSLPTGQAVAKRLAVTPLTPDELRRNSSANVTKALTLGGFFERTPLWFYLLKEAEVRANGNSLGEVGSRIVAETIIGHVRHDPKSYLSEGWSPAQGVRLPSGAPIATIRDFIEFAGIPA